MTISPALFIGHTFAVLSAGATFGWVMHACIRRAHRWAPAVYGRLRDESVPVRVVTWDDDAIWQRSNAGYPVTLREAEALHARLKCRCNSSPCWCGEDAAHAVAGE